LAHVLPFCGCEIHAKPGEKLASHLTVWLIDRVATTIVPSQSAEDYLERIHELIEEKGYARVVDIASTLDVKQASVTSMVQKLGELGFVKYEKYRGLLLTEKGREVATRIQKRHETLSRFFSLLGLDPKTVDCLADLALFFEQNPKVLATFLGSRREGRGDSR
jgi:DNA-binding MarR family transcriptional regulator